MSRQLAAGHKRHITALLSTLVRLHPGMSIDVIAQQRIRPERPRAKMAFVRSFVGVNFHVAYQVRVPVGVEIAFGTLIYFFLAIVTLGLCRVAFLRCGAVKTGRAQTATGCV